MDVGEEYFLKLNDGGPDIDWSEGYDINRNYNFLAALSLKFKTLLMKTKKCYLLNKTHIILKILYPNLKNNYYI